MHVSGRNLGHLNDEEFEAELSNRNTAKELAELYSHYNSDHPDNTAGQRVFDKAMELIATVDDAAYLWVATRSSIDKTNAVLVKMLEFANEEEDLDNILLTLSEEGVSRRDFLRLVFDKADQLGIPKI